jgi:hypothetical protein
MMKVQNRNRHNPPDIDFTVSGHEVQLVSSLVTFLVYVHTNQTTHGMDDEHCFNLHHYNGTVSAA